MAIANAILCLLLAVQAETVQVFVADEHVVIRTMPVEYAHGSGGWGDVVLECYVDGALYCSCGVSVVLNCCSADLDMDGDVDLADFAAFQREFER